MFGLISKFAKECYQRNRVLSIAGLVLLLGMVPMLILAMVDTRTITNVNPWNKPLKFSLSLVFYCLTLAWLLWYVSGYRRAVKIISWVTTGALCFETPILVLQAIRGVPSHFNTSTWFDGALYYIMGAAAFTQMSLLAWTFVLFFRPTIKVPPLYLYGIRAGMVMTLLCIPPGLMMVARAQHSVGVSDGGAGLPVVHWSTAGGDLRIAHFLSLHALQVLPLIGFLLSRARDSMRCATCGTALALVAAFYFATWSATLGLALTGRPLISGEHFPSELRPHATAALQ